MLPLEFVERVLAPELPGARFDRTSLELRTSGTLSDVVGIDYDAGGDVTSIHVRLSKPFRYRVQATSREIVRLVLSGAEIDPVGITADRPAAMIRSVRGEQNGDDAVLFFEVEGNLERLQDRAMDGGRTLLLTLKRAETPPPGRPMHLPEVESSRSDSVMVLVLDAGHGGFDKGVHGSGLMEKDVTLQLVRALQPLLERSTGVRVVLVREEDVTMAPERRAEIANRAHGDLLVSIHCNGWYDPHATGFETLFVPATNAGDGASPPGERFADFRPWDQAQQAYAMRSQELAEAMQVELGRHLASPNRGAKPAQVELLQGLAMPAVVLETGFLTNAQEASLLTSPDFVTSLARGIGAAVQRYRERYAPASSSTPGANP
jgi:N-acetylmuramoyl-L-alanine amidase